MHDDDAVLPLDADGVDDGANDPEPAAAVLVHVAHVPFGGIAQRCWDAFEPIVHARPEEYLWAYKHFRYRPRDATRAYPAYSNESGKFEKLLRAG